MASLVTLLLHYLSIRPYTTIALYNILVDSAPPFVLRYYLIIKF